MNSDNTNSVLYTTLNRKRIGIPLIEKLKTTSNHLPVDQFEIIDQGSLLFSVLKRICHKENVPLNCVLGYKHPPSLRELNLNTKNIDLESALEAFFDSQRSSSTEDSYRRAFEKLFFFRIVPTKSLLVEFISWNHIGIIEAIKCSSEITKSQQRAGTTAYLAFVRYVSDQIDRTLDIGVYTKDNFEASPENTPLTIAEWKLFVKTLRQINLRDALIAEVLNFANGFLNHPSRVVTLKEVLALRTSCISDHQITFWRRRGTLQGASLFFPERILEPLRQLCREPADLVFITSKGGPVRENQVKRSFANASKQASISRVSPTIVRLPIKHLKYCGICEFECVCM